MELPGLPVPPFQYLLQDGFSLRSLDPACFREKGNSLLPSARLEVAREAEDDFPSTLLLTSDNLLTCPFSMCRKSMGGAMCLRFFPQRHLRVRRAIATSSRASNLPSSAPATSSAGRAIPAVPSTTQTDGIFNKLPDVDRAFVFSPAEGSPRFPRP